MKPNQPVNVFYVSWRILAFLLAVSIGVAGGMAFRSPAPAVQACGECAQTTDTPQIDSLHWPDPGNLEMKEDFTPAESTAYSGVVTTCIADWNGTGTEVHFTKDAAGAIRITGDGANPPPNNWNAKTDIWSFGTVITAATVTLYNVRLIDSPAHNMHKRNTIGHELGHTFGLDHNTTDKGALLYGTCIGSYHDCDVSTPQTDDINGTNNIYP